MTNDAACFMNLELSTEHHEACELGEFSLTDQELEIFASILKAQAKQCPEFEGFSISMVAEYDEEQKQQQRTPAQEEIAQDEAAEMYVQKSKRARVSTDATAASSSAVLVRDSDSDSVCVTGDGRAARKRVSQKTARKEAIPLTESASVKSPPQAEIVTQRPCLNLDDDSLQYEVLEVMTRSDADSAVGLHLSKGTFASEEEYVKKRVHAGEVWRCRTWVLRGLLKPSDQERSYLAAVTCTMNPYKNKEGCWAQILNMSALRAQASVPSGMHANKTYFVHTVMPGLWDCHTHFAGVTVKSNFKVDEAYPLDHVAFYNAIEHLEETLMMGITSVREMGGPFGQPLNVLLQAGRIKGPNMHYAGRCIGITSGHTDSQLYPLDLFLKLDGERHTFGTLCDGVPECLKRTRENLRLQADVIKIMTSGGVLSEFDQPTDAQLSLEEVQAITADAKRARRAVAAHAHGTAGIQTAIDGGVTTVEHGSYLTEDQARQIIEKKYMVLTPTITIHQEYFNGTQRPSILDDNQWRKGLDVVRHNAKSAQMAIRMGVPIVAGTDCPNSCAEVGKEVNYLHMFGMSPLQAIQAATGDAPRCMGPWGLMPKSGRLELGYEADVIALNANPLDDLTALTRSSNITHVWKAGVLMKELAS